MLTSKHLKKIETYVPSLPSSPKTNSNLEMEQNSKLEMELKTKLELEQKTKLELELKTKLELEQKTKLELELKTRLLEMELKHYYELKIKDLELKHSNDLKDLELKHSNDLKDLELKFLSRREEPDPEPEPEKEKRKKKIESDDYMNTIKGRETNLFKDDLFNSIETYDVTTLYKKDDTLENVLIYIFNRFYSNEEIHAIYSRGYMIYRYFNNKWNIEFINVNEKDFFRRLVDRIIICLQEKGDDIGVEIPELTDYKKVYNAILHITELKPPENFEF
jgi:hypothetical protein